MNRYLKFCRKQQVPNPLGGRTLLTPQTRLVSFTFSPCFCPKVADADNIRRPERRKPAAQLADAGVPRPLAGGEAPRPTSARPRRTVACAVFPVALMPNFLGWKKQCFLFPVKETRRLPGGLSVANGDGDAAGCLCPLPPASGGRWASAARSPAAPGSAEPGSARRLQSASCRSPSAPGSPPTGRHSQRPLLPLPALHASEGSQMEHEAPPAQLLLPYCISF